MGDTALLTRPEARTERKAQQPRFWNVVLLDDQDHTYEYVILMLQELFACPLEKAFTIAKRVDADGRGVCLTTHREHAELKVEQIQGYGRDCLIAECKGSMSATLEPAEFDEGGNNDENDIGR